MRLSLRKKKFLSTRTTHKEELEYLIITLGELIKFRGSRGTKIFPEGKIPQRLIYNEKRIN